MGLLIGLVGLAGAFGGFINALITNDSVIRPHRIAGTPSWQLGIFGNIVVGAAAGAASSALYGLYSLVPIVSVGSPPGGAGTATMYLTLSAVTMAFLTGVGGTKWLNSEAQSDLWQATAAKAAAAQPDAARAAQILTSSASDAYRLF